MTDLPSPAGEMARAGALFGAGRKRRGGRGRTPMQDDIAAALELHGEMTPSEIAAAVDARTKHVYGALHQMSAAGRVVWTPGRLSGPAGKARLTRPGETPPPAPDPKPNLPERGSTGDMLQAIFALPLDARRRVCMKIAEVYDSKFYTPGWSDARIADDLAVPRKWVEAMREFVFGPADNPEIAEAKRALAESSAERAAIAEQMKTMQASLARIEERERSAAALIAGRKL